MTSKCTLYYLVYLAGTEAPESFEVLEENIVGIQRGKINTKIEYSNKGIYLGSH